MKKRILSVLLCLSMSVSMLVGCGSEGEETVKVTKKLEEQYVARIEAYQGYLDEIGDKYSEYYIGATVTLDNEGLPLMWLILGESDSWNDVHTTQLVGYEDKQATVLAEKGEAIVPYRGQLIMAQGYNDNAIYLYDEEEMSFVSVTDKLEYSDDYETIYSEKELDEKVEDLTQMLECTSFYDTIRMAMNDETHQLVYLGKSEPDFYCQALANLHVLLPVMNTKISDATDYYAIGLALRKEYAENKDVLDYFKQLEDAELDEDVRNEILSDEEVTPHIYDNTIKATSGISTFILPDGTVCTHEETLDYAGKIDIFTSDENWESFGGGEAGEFFDELHIERVLRELHNKPIYSQEELFVYLASLVYNCEIIEINLDDYILTNAPDDYVSGVVESYIRDSSWYESFYTDELIDTKSSLLETEPYKTIKEQGVDESSFEDNVATLLCYNGNEYQFQIEFNENGDKISKIEYIDPYASLSDWQKLYLAGIDNGTIISWEFEEYYADYCGYDLMDLNGDAIPELFLYEGRNTYIYTIYNNMVEGIVYCNDYPRIYNNLVLFNGYYEMVVYSVGTDSTDIIFCAEYDIENDVYNSGGNILSYQECLEEAEKVLGVDIDSLTTLEYNYDINSIRTAIMEYGSAKETSGSSATGAAEVATTEEYFDWMYCIDEFSLEGNRLKVYNGGTFSLDAEVSDDCVWQDRSVTDSVYDSSYEEIHELWESEVSAKEEADEMGYEYESPAGLGVEVKDGKVVAVYKIVP